MKNKIKRLPKELILKILKILILFKISYKKELNNEFLSNILMDSDIGSIIICRIQGMPLLEEID